MSIEVVEADGDQFEEWDRSVERSAGTNAFHRSAALRLLAAHSGTELHPLIGYKGQEPVGLFPVFEWTRWRFTAAFSPPPGLWIPMLGPAFLNVDKLSERKAERRRHRFLEGCLDWLGDACRPQYLDVHAATGCRDVRPFKWNGADVTPEFTYAVDLTGGEEAVLNAFSKNARRTVRGSYDEEYAIREGGLDDVRRILSHVERRYDDQGVPFRIPERFLAELFERLSDGTIRAYTCTVDGEYVGGILTFEDADRIRWWLGGAKPVADVDLPVNDLLNWHVMTDAMSRGVDRYDLGGAGDERLLGYKTKWGPELESFHRIRGGPRSVRAVASVYERDDSLPAKAMASVYGALR